MRRTKLLFCAIFATLLLLATLSQAQEKKTLRIVFVSLSWNNQLPFRVAIAKGFFKEQGLSVEPIFVRGGPTALAALISGDVDFASVGGAQAPIRSRAKGLDIHIIASQSNYTNYTLLGSKQAKTVEELRGKIVGVTGAGAFSSTATSFQFLERGIARTAEDSFPSASGDPEQHSGNRETRCSRACGDGIAAKWAAHDDLRGCLPAFDCDAANHD